MADRYRSPASSRGGSRKKRRFHYKNNPEAKGDSDIDSRSSISSNRSSSSSSTCVPVLSPSSIDSSTRPRHTDDRHWDDDSRRSQSSRRRRKHHRHHGRKALPAPDEEDEKPGYSTTVAIRDEYPVQTVPRRRQRDLSPDEEEVYDYRPRPLSRRHGTRYPERRRGHSESQGANNADRGFLMAAVMVIVSLFICIGEAD
ncbi:hypothetical protein N0V93_007436 [Gnomoniopsis smithogilvyi]|uniref:Uncharacterized protein n=1 Tax=Gnomoniopsis smithogilvyi TaxID=1191159 RepID=A0A9W8YQ26_9PEZI|nr:hypothetical protein N0V93_007436 [Gnomoniopsis smithogilvyi]